MINKMSEKPNNSDALGLLGYLIVVNKQVHNYQISLLEEYLGSIGLSLDLTELPDIIDGKDDALSFATAFSAFETEGHNFKRDLLYMMSALAYIDGVVDDNEKLLIDKVLESEQFSEEELIAMRDLAREEADRFRSSNNVLFEKPKCDVREESFLLRIWKWLKRVIMSFLKNEKRDNNDLEVNEYTRAIEKCALVAAEDFKKVRPAYSVIIESGNESVEAINRYKRTLSLETGISSEVAEVIGTFAEALHDDVIEQTKRAEESLMQKERTVPDFTISLIGRTKAGKSTLHSILTRQGEDKIGAGKQRTTRYNRVYQWNLLRLIDTPGIGSAEANGRTDDEIAESVLGETDVICFVIVDDSILKDVLEFVEKVAELNKPIVILLNHKENITSEVKYRRFIQNPTDWLTTEGESSLNGHINRIMTYAENKGFANLVKVFPVFLLAAQMATKEQYIADRGLLWNSSNLDIFIEQLKIWITSAGSIKRSQTIIDEAVSIFDKSKDRIKTTQTPVLSLIERLTEQKSKKQSDLKNIKEQTVENIRLILKDKFAYLANNEALIFAEEIYDKDVDTSKAWKSFIKKIGFEEEIELAIKDELGTFSNKIDETVRDLFEDFYYSVQTSMKLGQIKIPIQIDFRSITRLAGSAIGVAGTIVTIVLGASNPVGWILTGAGIIVGLGSMLFSSREKKRQKAIEKIYTNIKSNIEGQCDEQIEITVNLIDNELDKSIRKVDYLLNDLIDGLHKTIAISDKLVDSYTVQIDYMNRLYAYRLLQHLRGDLSDFTQEAFESEITSVDRSEKGIIYIESPNKLYDTTLLDGIIAEKVIVR